MQGSGVKGESQSEAVRHNLRIRISNGQERAGSITLSWLRVAGSRFASNVLWTENAVKRVGIPMYYTLVTPT